MTRLRSWLVPVALVAAAAVTPSAAAGDPYCCIESGLKATYEVSRNRIVAHWAAPPGGVTAVELRAGDRLGADGIVDLSSRSVRVRVQGDSASVGAGRLEVVLVNRAGVFVQVRFTCAARTPKPCASGSFWSKPVHVTAEEANAAGDGDSGGSPLTIVQQAVRLKSNGSQACESALVELRRLIKLISANTAAAKEAHASGRSTKPYLHRQRALMKLFDAAYAAAKTACAK